MKSKTWTQNAEKNRCKNQKNQTWLGNKVCKLGIFTRYVELLIGNNNRTQGKKIQVTGENVKKTNTATKSKLKTTSNLKILPGVRKYPAKPKCYNQ